MSSIIRDVTIKSRKEFNKDEIMLFIGARQSGKTTILKQIEFELKKTEAPCYFINLEDPDYLELLNKSPKNLFKIFNIDLKKRNFVFIDEIQYLNNPSNFLKYFFDEYRGKIKLLVSGSSAFYIDKKFKDSLAGRKKIFYVRTLSFREFLRFKDERDLSAADFNKISLAEKEKARNYYNEYIVFGGYPRVVLSPPEEKEEILKDIVYSYIKKDVYDANIKQDEIFYKLFKILSSQAGNLVNSSELAHSLDVSKTAVDNYLYVMQKSFHIVLLKPFFKNIRKEIIKMPKVYFMDMGLRNFFVSNFQTYQTREDKSVLLENAAFRQLAEKYGVDELKFWRTIQKNEVDFVANGKEAFEVKVNPRQIKKSNYKIFLEKYPNIDFSIVSLDVKSETPLPFKILEVWQI